MKNKNDLKAVFLFVLFSITVINAWTEDFLNYGSGIYNEDILVSVNRTDDIGDVFYSFGDDSKPAVRYRGGLLLSALPGEERSYTLELFIDGTPFSYNYLIDKRKPETPEAVYSDDSSSYGYSFYEESDADIYYGYDEDRLGEEKKWTGELIMPPKSGIIYYYAADSAGNRSGTGIIKPADEISNSGRAVLTVKSPVEGEFSNTQLLFIDKKGFDWIKYTLNGSDPIDSGVLYSTPVEIRRYGNVILKIAAKPANSSKIIQKEINYRVNTKAPLKNIPDSGIYSGSINIKSNLRGYRYCLEDRSPVDGDPFFDGDIVINPVYGGVKYTSFRLLDTENDQYSDFRYFYIIDDRIPANPIIECTSRLPGENLVDVKITGPDYADIYYTVDGSTPGKSSNKYGEIFSLPVPDGKNAGSIIIKAKAISLNGKAGNIVSSIFTYDTKKPEAPDVMMIRNEDSGLYSLDYSIEAGSSLFFRCSDSANAFYPVDGSNFFADTPVGTTRDYSLDFAAVDSAGNRSEPAEPIIFTIDKTVPQTADVKIEDGKVLISSEYNTEYSFETVYNGRITASGEGTYSEAFEIGKTWIPGTVLRLSVDIINPAGKKYTEYYKFENPLISDEKEAVLFSRKADVFSGAEVEFFAYPDGIDEKLYYYLTEVKINGNKITEGPYETDGRIVIAGTENKSKDYFLEIYSSNEETGTKSKISSYRFTIDNEKPPRPYITGLESGVVSNEKIIISHSADEDSVVFLNYSDSPETIGKLFSSSSIIFNENLVFDVPSGEEKKFYLIAGAGDAAGNSTINDEVFTFTIDRKPPLIDDIIKDSSSIEIISSENIKCYYEKGEYGTFIREPDKDSEYFTEKLVFEDISDTDGRYILNVLPYDESGNRFYRPLTYSYIVDRKEPSAEPSPEILVNEKIKKVFTYWKETSEDLYYSINQGEWNLYEHPFSFKYQSDTSEYTLDYYFEDSSGNRSKTVNIAVQLPGSGDSVLSEGINNNGYYSEDLELRPAVPESLIRYEISTDQIMPPEVSVFSPVLPEKLPFRIEKGESINFIVSLKEFNGPEDRKGGAEQVIRFTIDKQPPEPPEIDGIKDGEYYLTDRTAFFNASENDIFYSVSSADTPEEDFIRYTEPFTIVSKEGSYNSFTISAYTRDYSGNKSSTRSWKITIDKEIIYVSNDGRDYYEGTRSWPFASLNKALEQVKLSNRKTIFIEEGDYLLNSPAVIDEEISLYGGFKKGSWNEKSGTTTLSIPEDFLFSNPAFYIYGGSLTINNINVISSDNVKESVFLLNKGNLNLRNISVTAECSGNSSFINQSYGKLSISNTDIQGTISEAPFINSDYGIVNISQSVFRAGSSYRNSMFLKATNCIDFSLNSSDINVASGKSITALSFSNCSAAVKSTSIESNDNSVSSTAIECVDTKLAVTYSKFRSNKNNRLSQAVVSEDSVLNFSGNNFDLKSKSGIIAFNLTGGESLFFNNHISCGPANDFSYTYLLSGGNNDIETNIFRINEADEIVNVRSKNAGLDYLNNTVEVYGGQSSTFMFKVEGTSVNRVINNIFTQKNAVNNNTLIYDSSDNAMISFKNNCLYGWNKYIDGKYTADTAIGLDLIDGVYTAGRFADNIEEPPEKTFSEGSDYLLSSESRCIDSGYDLTNIIVNSLDIDGESRPNRMLNRNSEFDIGADEYYR